ncbi:hypothetical protein JCM10908_005913 [Rhodotorula pacifica]|uniref:uncharacterized protein n=1 Tax=Rhodotorula pacifica TaxID=1495444 RepID=UPI00317638B4
MHVIKPNWVAHPDETRATKPDLTIFSLDVHPDNSRVATGGLDSLVKVWSTVPILNEQAEKDGDEKCPKLLSTLTAHTGVVMSVRWNNAGSYLASGSDDRVVVIWAHDGGRGGKVWGTETTNVENWKATRRLVGHQSDVAGVAWSPDDALVASVGLDNVVLVWSGHTFELVRKLDAHVGFVKGVVFDPVGQYLATQADDNSLKIWRTDDWVLERDITEPFEDAPKATILRPAWSPDGAFVVTPNSMNGPVFCAAVLSRQSWTTPASLIGHLAQVQVAAYNPLIFLRDATPPAASSSSASMMNSVCSLLAIAAQGTVSLWFTDLSQPFAVLTDLFDRDVLDLSWSKDGKQLWASSSDGQIAVVTFEYAEFAPIAPDGTQDRLFAEYGYKTRVRAAAVARPALTTLSGLANGGGGTVSQPNALVARKGPGAKRPRAIPLQPPVIPSMASSSAANPFANAAVAPGPAPPINAFASTSAAVAGPAHFASPAFGAAAAAPAAAGGPVNDLNTSRKRKAPTQVVDGFPPPGPPQQQQQQPVYYPYDLAPAAPPPQIPGYGSAPRLSNAPYRLQGETIGRGDPAPPDEELRELVPAYALYDREVTFRVTNGKGKEREEPARTLAVPAVMSMGKLGVEDSDAKDTLEWRNFASGARKGEAEITVVTAKKSLWTDYLPRYVVAAAGSAVFTAVGLEDGSLVAWSPTGRRLLPTLVLDAPCSFLTAEGSYLMAITALGTLTVWDLSPSIPKPRSIYPPLNISSLLSSSASAQHPDPMVTTSALLPNGTPLLALDSGATYSYDADLAAWTRISETWWSKAETWEARRGRNATAVIAPGRGVIRTIEAAINEVVLSEQAGVPALSGSGGPNSDTEMGEEGSALKRAVPEGPAAEPTASSDTYRLAISLAHLETRIKAAASLDSPSEYRLFLLAYAKRLADEGLRSKAEELIRELLGPIYHKPGKKEEDEWVPTVVGLPKRELLRDVLRELAKQRVTTPLANEYQDLLKKITSS